MVDFTWISCLAEHMTILETTYACHKNGHSETPTHPCPERGQQKVRVQWHEKFISVFVAAIAASNSNSMNIYEHTNRSCQSPPTNPSISTSPLGSTSTVTESHFPFISTSVIVPAHEGLKSMLRLPVLVALVYASNTHRGVEKPACTVMRSANLGAIFHVCPPAERSWMPAI